MSDDESSAAECTSPRGSVHELGLVTWPGSERPRHRCRTPGAPAASGAGPPDHPPVRVRPAGMPPV